MKQYINKYFSIFFGALLFFATQGFAQESYLLKELRIPQVAQENPGAIIPYDAHISFPGLGKIHFGLNLPCAYGDLFDISDKFLKNVSKSNAVRTRTWFELDPIHFGFRSGKNYFSITTAIKMDMGMTLQKDLFALVIEGNEKERTIVKNDFLSMNMYAEFGLGYNREVNENFSFGVNAKYLTGFFNAHTKKANLTLRPGENFHELILNGDLDGKFACIYDIYGEFESNDDDSRNNEFSFSASDFFKNHGFSFDLGARYKINDMFEVSASVLDIGLIKWKTSAREIKSSNNPFYFRGYEFEGNIFEDFNDKKLDEQVKEYFKEVGDSLLNHYDSDIEEVPSYTKWLNTKFNVGFSFYATKKDRFNLNFRGLFINSMFVPSGSVSYTRNCGKWFDVVIGNTFKENSLLNPGLGLNLTLNVFQIYAAVDYINSIYIDRLKNVNVVVGINFVAPLRENRTFKASLPY